MWIKLFISLCITYTLSSVQCLQITNKCYSLCRDHHYCRTMNYKHDRNTELVLVAEGKSDYKKWPLNNVTFILSSGMEEDEAIKLSCYAHQNSINYGFLAQVPGIANTSSPEFIAWVGQTQVESNFLYADAIVFDFLNLVGKCHVDDQHIEEVMEVVSALHETFMKNGPQQMICIMPWKPPCFHGNCSLVEQMKNYCSMFILNPESFISTCDDKCNAKATVPMSSLVIGINEYLNSQIPIKQLLVGIPWHGYDYTCNKYESKTALDGADSCYVPRIMDENNVPRCDYNTSRKKMSLSELAVRYKANFESQHHWSAIYHAPYFGFEYKNSQNISSHQVWFENFNSLFEKYRLVKDLSLRGVVIYTADDISQNEALGTGEFNWLMHNLFASGQVTLNKHGLNVAATAAGIGVGCFVLGTVLGIVTGCAVSRRLMFKKHRRLPFERDDDDGYHDDDLNL